MEAKNVVQKKVLKIGDRNKKGLVLVSYVVHLLA
jgi:hypothetical protein